MGRKAGTEQNKKEEILAAAQRNFLEYGFDGTSVRSIMKQAGAEIGLFYYYFKNKDEAFDLVLDRFFAGYEADFAQIVKRGKRNPCRVMENFFEYMERETAAFREKYAEKMHRTVRWAIREHTLTLIEPYLRQVVEIQSRYYGTATPIAPEAAALYLTHGVGSAILHEDREEYFRNRSEIKRGVSLLMGMPMEQQALRIPQRASADDAAGCLTLFRQWADCFPGLAAEDETQLSQRIEDGEVWVFRQDAQIPAAILFSRERQTLDFLAVSPAYRGRGLAQKLLETAAAQFPVGAALSVVADCGPSGADDFYAAMGFTPCETLTLLDRPCQRLTAVVPDGPFGQR